MPKIKAEKKSSSLLINKEDSPDEEFASDDQYESEEDARVTSEYHLPDRKK